MNYVRLALMLCVLAQASTIESMNKEKLKKIFKAGSTAIFFGCALNDTKYSLKSSLYEYNNFTDTDPDVAQFTREVLQEAGYPESFCSSIKIKKSNSFESLFDVILVPFSEQHLKNAKILASKKISYQSLYTHSCMLENIYQQLPEYLPREIKGSLLISKGMPVNEQTLSIWKNAIIHEAGHIVHYDAIQKIAFPIIFASCIHFGTKKIPFCHFLPVRYVLYKGLLPFARILHNKHREYWADQEVIKRCTSPEALEQKALFFENFHQAKTLERIHTLEQLQEDKAKVEEIILEASNLKEMLENKQTKDKNKHISYEQKSTEDVIQASIVLHKILENKHATLSKKIALQKEYPLLLELEYLLHPSALVRSKYFKKAAEELRIKQQK